MVTKDQLDQLRAERTRAQPSLDYTIGGTVETSTNRHVSAARESRIAHGEQTLQESLQQLRNDHAFAVREGYSAAHFNQSVKETIT